MGEVAHRFTPRIEHESCKLLETLLSCHLFHDDEDNCKEFRSGPLSLLKLAEFSILGQTLLNGRTHPTNIHPYQSFLRKACLCVGEVFKCS